MSHYSKEEWASILKKLSEETGISGPEEKPKQKGPKLQEISREPIHKLDQVMERLFAEPVARSDEELEKLQNDRYYYYSRVAQTHRPLPKEVTPVIEKAITIWRQLESFYLSRIGESLLETPGITVVERDHIEDPKVFARVTERILDGKFSERDLSRLINILGLYSNMIVYHISWVEMFAFKLPVLDPENREQYLSIGRTMLGIFAAELIYRHLDSLREKRTFETFQQTDEYNKLCGLLRMIRDLSEKKQSV